MMDRKYGSLVSLSPHVCFLKILATTCRIDKRSHAFPFESYGVALCCLFMTSQCKVFLVIDGMTFWLWKK